MENIEITVEFSRFALKTRKKEPPKTPRIEPLKDFPNSLGIKELPLYLARGLGQNKCLFYSGCLNKMLNGPQSNQHRCKVLPLFEASISDCAVGFNPFPAFSRGNLGHV